MRFKWPFLVLAIIFLPFLTFAQDGKELYSTHCAGCHGTNLQGTSSNTSLIKTDWKHGGDRNEIEKTIRNGIPSTVMTSWENRLSDDDIEAIVNFIISSQEPTPEESISAPSAKEINSKEYDLLVETLISENLNTPWGIEFINRDSAIISEKEGSLSWIINGKLDPNCKLPHFSDHSKVEDFG